MPPVNTREGTEVFTGPLQLGAIVSFICKPLERVNRFHQTVFSSDERHEGDSILASLNHRLEVEVARKREGKRQKRPVVKTPQPSRKDKVNMKREFIRRVLAHQSNLNLREVARYTKCCWSTVKSVRNETLVHGELTPYEYNFLKTQQEMIQLDETIDAVLDTGMGVTEIKRVNPTFSKKKILDHMHQRGLKYTPLPRERKVPKFQPPSSTRVCRVISHLCQALASQDTEILYCDEMKFPLCQTSTHAWTSLPQEEREVYNRRPDERLLTAIAMCSTKGFVAVQVYSKEVSATEFLYFINKAIASLPVGRSYSCLLDNAGWHLANLVASSEASKFFFFNEPRMFQLNIIENAFSFVRDAFRKRPVVETMEEEAREILRIFFAEENKKRFKGLLRNHLRQLIKYHEKHWGD
jgi:hypothetical protein